jgi:hypothetical protein
MYIAKGKGDQQEARATIDADWGKGLIYYKQKGSAKIDLLRRETPYSNKLTACTDAPKTGWGENWLEIAEAVNSAEFTE